MFDPILLVLLFLLAGALYLAFSVIQAAQPKNNYQIRHRGQIQKSRQARSERDKKLSQIKRASLNSRGVNSATRKKLLTMLQGNQEVALRLLERTQYTHPDKSEQWRWEKVIWDLERDRN
jgi:hypothetical protein